MFFLNRLGGGFFMSMISSLFAGDLSVSALFTHHWGSVAEFSRIGFHGIKYYSYCSSSYCICEDGVNVKNPNQSSVDFTRMDKLIYVLNEACSEHRIQGSWWSPKKQEFLKTESFNTVYSPIAPAQFNAFPDEDEESQSTKDIDVLSSGGIKDEMVSLQCFKNRYDRRFLAVFDKDEDNLSLSILILRVKVSLEFPASLKGLFRRSEANKDSDEICETLENFIASDPALIFGLHLDEGDFLNRSRSNTFLIG
jgi:hypothetical protein